MTITGSRYATDDTDLRETNINTDAINTKVGEVQTSPTSNTILARLKDINTSVNNVGGGGDSTSILVGSLYGTKTITNSATELKLGASALVNRKAIIIDNISNKPIYIGFDSSVTISNGLLISAGMSRTFYLKSTESQLLYAISTSSITIRMAELKG